MLIIQPIFSPLNFAASTYSITTIFIPTALDNLNTLVESSTAIIRIRLSAVEPKIDKSISAKIKLGIAIKISTNLASIWSTQPLKIADNKPKPTPIKNARKVVISAIPIVFLAPYTSRLNISLPNRSVPKI